MRATIAPGYANFGQGRDELGARVVGSIACVLTLARVDGAEQQPIALRVAGWKAVVMPFREPSPERGHALAACPFRHSGNRRGSGYGSPTRALTNVKLHKEVYSP
jgi:hypothetical protein